MSLPAGWPAPADVETLPTVWLRLDGSAWPPAQDGRPAGLVPVGSWSVDRELVGATLPGNIRARSGLSVGAASASIAQMAVEPLAPWAATDDRRVTTGRAVELYATHAGHATPVRVDLGDWTVAPTSGALLAPNVDVDLIERQSVGRRQLNALPDLATGAGPVDAAWIVDALARQVGYYSTPAAAPSAILSVPCAGSLQPEVGTLQAAPSSIPPTWDRAAGPITTGRQARGFWYFDGYTTILDQPAVSAYLTLNAVGVVGIETGDPIAYVPTGGLEVRPGGVLAVRSRADVAWTTGTYTPGLDPAQPQRVEIEMQRLGTPGDMGPAAWTAFRARARSSASAPWSAWVTSTASSQQSNAARLRITAWLEADGFAGVQVCTAPGQAWGPVNADIDPLGVLLSAPWLAADVDVWTGIQDVCASTLGAAWVTRNRVLTVMNRSRLIGAEGGRTPKLLDVGLAVEDLAWTVDPDDTADRLEVTYTPPDVVSETLDSAPEVWSTPDAVTIPANSTVDVVVDLNQAVGGIQPAVPAWSLAYNLDVMSVWAAATSRDGTGPQPADNALSILWERVTAGRGVLHITNNTAQTLFTVDGEGRPLLILRAITTATFDSTVTISRGLPATEAVNVMAVTLGHHVQRAADAAAIADYLWGRVSDVPWRADSVRIKLDWTIDLGDVLRLVHQRSGLDIKALVTKVAYDGSPGEIAQTIDLVLLPPVWADFDTAWNGKTWAGFDTAWSGSTWNAFDRDPTRST